MSSATVAAFDFLSLDVEGRHGAGEVDPGGVLVHASPGGTAASLQS